MKKKMILFITTIAIIISCSSKKQHIYLGADLSYVNEMEDCGGIYHLDGEIIDPFELFQSRGANLIRVRLWHSPDWSGYSDYKDVEKTIRRAKNAGMDVLLDFHYSDTWADPQKQIIPKAWKEIGNIDILGDSLYNYNLDVLNRLNQKGLAPALVQIGNETNIEILQAEEIKNADSINWERNIFLLNKGIEAVDDFNINTGKQVEKIVHIAQPENALWWFGEATQKGLDDFEWIGLSYYPKWSTYKFDDLPKAIRELKTRFGKRVMIVETAYPHTMDNADSAGNILGDDALIPGYPATPLGQLNYLKDLTLLTIAGGGEGLIYWEPAWISTSCSTPWGQGSHWDNATFFDAANGNEALQAFGFFEQNNYISAN